MDTIDLPPLPEGMRWETKDHAANHRTISLYAEKTKWCMKYGTFEETLAVITKKNAEIKLSIWRKGNWEYLPFTNSEIGAANYVLGLAVMGGIDFEFVESSNGN